MGEGGNEEKINLIEILVYLCFATDFGLPLFCDGHELISFKASRLIEDVDVFIKGFREVNKLLADG